MHKAFASTVVLFAVAMVGCGDASAPINGHGGGYGGADGKGSGGGGSSTQTPPSQGGATNPTPTPEPQKATGSVRIRAANFLSIPIDYCIKGADDATFMGPVFKSTSTRSIGPGQVTERGLLKNAKFTVRLVDGAATKCDAGAAAPDVELPILPADSPITLVFAQEPARAVTVKALVDEGSAAPAVSFIRFVNVATIGTPSNADLVAVDNDNGDTFIGVNAPFLGTGTAPGQSPRGFVAVEPLLGNALVLKPSGTDKPVVTAPVVTKANELYSIFALGTGESASLLMCSDSQPGNQGLSLCNVIGGAQIPGLPIGGK
jgi:hypothetical protein